MNEIEHITLGWNDRGNIQDFDGPGWYLSSTRSEGHEWYTKPRRVTPDQARAIALALDQVLGGTLLTTAVNRRNGRARAEAEEAVTRAEKAYENVVKARDRLAEFKDVHT